MSDDRFLLGVTGNIASGKSTVSLILAGLGAIVIDSDLVYRELVGPGQPLLDRLVVRFGDGIRAADGSLDRPTLGAIVFSDAGALGDLDRLTHPAVIAEVDRRVTLGPEGVVVIDAVKLVESGHDARCDRVWLVVASPERQVTRLIKRNKLSRAEAERRVKAQPSLDAKLASADLVIDNNGSLGMTRDQVIRAWQQLPINPLAHNKAGSVSHGGHELD